MPEIESESKLKPSRRLERQATRKRQPQNVRLGVFLSANDADQLDQEAEGNGLSMSSYLRILISCGRKVIMAEAEARDAEAAEARRQPPKDSFEHARRLAEEAELRRHQGDAQAKALARSTVRDGRR